MYYEQFYQTNLEFHQTPPFDNSVHIKFVNVILF
jgi:hypothetical protein